MSGTLDVSEGDWPSVTRKRQAVSFSEQILDPSRRPQVVAAIAGVIESTVESQSGLSGMAIKTAFASAKKAKAGIVEKGTDKLLPEIAEALAPYWDGKGDQEFGAYLAANSSEAADKLLAVADENAAKADNAAMAKMYKGVRGKAKGIVEEALPKLGAAIAPFAA